MTRRFWRVLFRLGVWFGVLLVGIWLGTNLAGVPLSDLFLKLSALVIVSATPLQRTSVVFGDARKQAHPWWGSGEYVLYPDLRSRQFNPEIVIRWTLRDGREGELTRRMTLDPSETDCLWVLRLDGDGSPIEARRPSPGGPIWGFCDFRD